MNSFTFFLILIPILAGILLAVNLLFATHNPYQEKDSVFECGFHSFLGQNRSQFSISFFIFALLFLLFDLEILLVYPYIVSANSNAIYGLAIMLIFFILLTLGFVFELGKKALTIDSRQSIINNVKPIIHTNIHSGFILNCFYFHSYIMKWLKITSYVFKLLIILPSLLEALKDLPAWAKLRFHLLNISLLTSSILCMTTNILPTLNQSLDWFKTYADLSNFPVLCCLLAIICLSSLILTSLYVLIFANNFCEKNIILSIAMIILIFVSLYLLYGIFTILIYFIYMKRISIKDLLNPSNTNGQGNNNPGPGPGNNNPNPNPNNNGPSSGGNGSGSGGNGGHTTQPNNSNPNNGLQTVDLKVFHSDIPENHDNVYQYHTVVDVNDPSGQSLRILETIPRYRFTSVYRTINGVPGVYYGYDFRAHPDNITPQGVWAPFLYLESKFLRDNKALRSNGVRLAYKYINVRNRSIIEKALFRF